MEELNRILDFYDINKALSYDKLLNFIIGGRGVGKTYGVKKHVIKKAIKKKEEFIYVRRTKEDLSKIDTFFNDIIINDEFPNYNFKVEGGKNFTIFKTWKKNTDEKKAKIIGYSAPLSTYQKFKSTSFIKITSIIYDEFIPENGGYSNYIPNEVELFLNLCDSIIRERDNVKIILLANTVNIVNPYFSYFKISPNRLKEFNTFKNNENILVEICQKEYKKNGKKSRFKSLIQDTKYGSYNQGNFINNNENFIKKKTSESIYFMTLFFNDEYYGCWLDYDTGELYINKQINLDYYYSYSLGNERQPNMFLSKNWRKDRRLDMLISSYRKGNLFYNSMETKYKLDSILLSF